MDKNNLSVTETFVNSAFDKIGDQIQSGDVFKAAEIFGVLDS